MKKIYCFSKNWFETEMKLNKWNKENDIPENLSIISICCPGEDHYFNNSDKILNIDFQDITDYILEGKDKIYYGLSDSQAEEIFNFIEQNKNDNFYIHCSAGMSRSQAVTRFISEFYSEPGKFELNPNNNDMSFANLHVYSLLKHLWYGKYNS